MNQTTPSHHEVPTHQHEEPLRRIAGARPSPRPVRHYPVQVRASFRRLARPAGAGPSRASTLS